MTEPTKTRPGDQPLPTPGRECVQDALIQLIRERRDLGVQRYGSALMTHNGRDAGRDALEEALDLTVYLMQVRMEQADRDAGATEDGGAAAQILYGVQRVVEEDNAMGLLTDGELAVCELAFLAETSIPKPFLWPLAIRIGGLLHLSRSAE